MQAQTLKQLRKRRWLSNFLRFKHGWPTTPPQRSTASQGSPKTSCAILALMFCTCALNEQPKPSDFPSPAHSLACCNPASSNMDAQPQQQRCALAKQKPLRDGSPPLCPGRSRNTLLVRAQKPLGGQDPLKSQLFGGLTT